MYPLALLLPLLALARPAFSSTLDPSSPIYLGEIFWPPTMTFIAWLPTADESPTSYCRTATDASDHRLFSLGGVDALQIQDYFSEKAYLSREGKRFADCWITPETGRIGACEGKVQADCADAHKFTGPATRRWSCWVVEGEREKLGWGVGKGASNGTAVKDKENEDVVTDKDARMTETAAVTGAMASSSLLGAFTPGVTGS